MAGTPFLDRHPFPFAEPAGNQLWRVLAGLLSVPRDAINLAEQFRVDPLDLPPGLTPRQLWHVILETTASQGTTRALVKAMLAQFERSPHAPFLRGLLADEPLRVSPEPMEGFDAAVTEPEALLFSDDLTLQMGLVPSLVATLQRLLEVAPAVCLLRVENSRGMFFGTGFKIGPELVLTNEHVLFPKEERATSVRADFGFDIDTSGASLPVLSLAGDVPSIRGDRTDDWAVVRVAGMPADIRAISLANAPVPQAGQRAFIVQHPDGQQKRLGFVRNTISAVTDDRVQYVTDTQPGSSGAPVFDGAGQLIALHHRGGTPSTALGRAPATKNQGVRISRVVSAMKALGVVA